MYTKEYSKAYAGGGYIEDQIPAQQPIPQGRGAAFAQAYQRGIARQAQQVAAANAADKQQAAQAAAAPAPGAQGPTAPLPSDT